MGYAAQGISFHCTVYHTPLRKSSVLRLIYINWMIFHRPRFSLSVGAHIVRPSCSPSIFLGRGRRLRRPVRSPKPPSGRGDAECNEAGRSKRKRHSSFGEVYALSSSRLRRQPPPGGGLQGSNPFTGGPRRCVFLYIYISKYILTIHDFILYNFTSK